MITDNEIQLMIMNREEVIIKTVIINDIPYDIISAIAMMTMGSNMLRILKVSPSIIEDLFLKLASKANSTAQEMGKEKNG